MSEPHIRSINVDGVGREEYPRGTVGFYLLDLVEQGDQAKKELRDRELHHFEAEKALTDLLALSWAITRDSHCSHLGADIRALIPADIVSADQHEQEQ